MSKRLNNLAKLAVKIKHGGYGMQIGYYSYSESPEESLPEEEAEKIREQNRIIMKKKAEKKAKIDEAKKRKKTAKIKAAEEKRKKKRQRRAEMARNENMEFFKISEDSRKTTHWQTRYSRGNLNCGWECSYCGERFSDESDFLNHLRDEEFVSLVAQLDDYYCPLYRCGHECCGFSFSQKVLKIRNLSNMIFSGKCLRPPEYWKKEFIVDKDSIKVLRFNDEDPITQIRLKNENSKVVLIYNSKTSANSKEK